MMTFSLPLHIMWHAALMNCDNRARHPPTDVSVTPGVSSGCWDDEFTYERCCLNADNSCWAESSGFSRTTCCSAFYETMLLLSAKDNMFPALQAPLVDSITWSQDAPLDLRQCVTEHSDKHYHKQVASARASSDSGDAPYETATLCWNNFIEVVGCLARRPEVNVVLDLFLGGGCTASAAAYGLGLERRGRPAELFSFEASHKTVTDALGADGRIGTGSTLGWWRSVLVNLTYDEESYTDMQTQLITSARDRSTTVWVFAGRPYPQRSVHKQSYVWNALDAFCQHRAPLDAVIVDPFEAAIEDEWMIIEAVCRPRRVLLTNLNIQSGASWIKDRLELLGHWHLEVQGHYVLHNEIWYGLSEVRRVRMWAIYALHSM